jgi:hypothetical protein
VLIYLFKIHATSAHFNLNSPGTVIDDMFGPNHVYTAGKFDLETWNCDLSSARPDVFRSACRIEQVRRWFMLPHALITLAMVATGIWASRQDKRLVKALEVEKMAQQNIRHWVGSRADFSDSEKSLTSSLMLPPIDKVATVPMTPNQVTYDEYLGPAFCRGVV